MRFEDGTDQAEGLRRLLVCNRTQAVTVVAGKAGIGRTSVIVNLAAALTRSGKDVLVLDENPAPGNLADYLGLSARHDLLDVAQGKCKLVEAVLTDGGFGVLPAGRAMDALAELPQAGRQRLENALIEVNSGVDVLLVDAAMPGPSRGRRTAVSAGLTGAAALLVVMDATVSGITESYALIKRLAVENACTQFGIVVNKAVDEPAALTVFNNMAAVARRNLAVRLAYLGHIPRDDRLKCATRQGRAVVDAFPASVSARACLALSEKLLRLPVPHDATEDGIRAIFRGLIRQAPQRHSEVSSPSTDLRTGLRPMAHVVN